MDFVLSMINACTSGLISLVLIAAVLSPRVHDGVIVKTGLIAMALGFGSVALRMADGTSAGDGVGLGRAILLICSGFTVVLIGYFARAWRAGHQLVRRTDWSDFDSRPHT